MKKAFLSIGIAAACIGALVILWVTHPSCSARGDGEDLAIGMNLSTLSYWTRELPFVDVARTSMPWVTQNDRTVPGGRNPWNTDLIGSIPLDADGYPLSLPVEVPGAEAPQITATLMCSSIEGRYPAGRYVCLYEGTGELGFSLDAKEAARSPGRIELDVRPSKSGILMKILRSVRGDHVRNIRVIMPGHEATYTQRPFNPLFLRRLEPFRVIRFMDWQRTNNSVFVHWDQRTKPSTYTQTGPRGVAIEHMVDLCNTLGADPWFCIPHAADRDCIRQFARLVKASLRPERKVYLEYSNEVWNTLFTQHGWVAKHGDASLSPARKYASFARQAFAVWQEEFGADRGRIVRVASGQQVRPALTQDIVEALGPSGMDALATSGYFGLGAQGHADLKSLGERATDHDVLRNVYDNMRSREIPFMERHAGIAARHGIRYITYEGGPSICPHPPGTSPAYRKALWDAQRSPELYSMYREFISACRDMHMGLFMAYSFVSAQETPYGSWGHLGYLDEPADQAPKYRALLDEIRGRSAARGVPPKP
ncbi:MAG TPA: hypothetical protein PLR71_03045 [Deltaproteobacteria bacterium]|nr:hypothetical protein [Deltaproteobacteria bacterium]